ncbi:nicotinate-nucleotide adenylyltransferase [Desulfoscipio gibsoniae]|uniref:Probable nicotinate-nucleotide adenylyltransferase n=1 Tax=Desulfoscipio gibsoniae DSM 7213 TaxID=767817 RepID=R4KSQ8_9FIRM|nr:nicotinate-nucleotide adenylyltransferase [Desulfoscipio gibsoniae]AGL02631.1 nicotinate/nicotinamide nucleotide adenylyltransferase [Desulfoscipio gibsoniae DSM 7213]
MNNSLNQPKKRRIGLMGGTFDPIHHGHLVAAEEARYQFGMEKVIFIPAGKPPHKTRRDISLPGHRLEMTKRAISSNPHFTISDLEIKREGLSYTIDTVRAMKEVYVGWEIYFITGSDAVLEILTWKNVEGLLEECFFVAATRPGFQLGSVNHLPKGAMAKIKTIEVPALAISSTDIRHRVREGRPIKYLLPEAVEKFIFRKKLYQQ